MELIFVPDAARDHDPAAAERKLAQITPYLWAGWQYAGWHSAPYGSPFEGMTGLYFLRVFAHSGPGFGAQPLCDRLASGLIAAMEVK